METHLQFAEIGEAPTQEIQRSQEPSGDNPSSVLVDSNTRNTPLQSLEADSATSSSKMAEETESDMGLACAQPNDSSTEQEVLDEADNDNVAKHIQKEITYGITDFVSVDLQGFSGILKKRYVNAHIGLTGMN